MLKAIDISNKVANQSQLAFIIASNRSSKAKKPTTLIIS